MIAECLSEDRIVLNLDATDFNEAVSILAARSGAPDPAAISRKVLDREKLMTTCLGRGAALPRACANGIERPEIIVGILPRGVNARSFDRRPVFIIFLHVFPPTADGSKILSQSLRLLGDENFRHELIRAASPAELIRIVGRWEQP